MATRTTRISSALGKAVRVKKKARPVANADALDSFLATEPTDIAAEKDPALVAATILLGRVLQADGTSFAAAGCDGTLVTVYLSELSWLPVVKDAWRINARDGRRGMDGSRAQPWDSADWWYWAPEEAPRGYVAEAQPATFASAVASLRHCAGFAPDLDWLPRDLVLGADHRLDLPVLTGSDVATIAREVCGSEATITLDDGDAAQLTPRLLRLARRVGQSADSYLGNLKQLLARDLEAQAQPAPIPKPTTVRELPTLERLHGMEEAVEWGLNLARDIKSFREEKIQWADVDRGILLSGPPGCGKTLFARALAASCEIPLISGSFGEWHGSGGAHQGDLLKAMARTFARARELVPSILFIDEIDSFPNRAFLTHAYADWEIQVVNALLAEIDGVQGRDGVVLVAACNMPQKLDPALVRSGRLDRHIRVGLPNVTALKLIMREHLGTELVSADLHPAAVLAIGSTGADIERFVRSARGRARRAGRDICLGDLTTEITGGESESPTLLRISASHEAGHAVACCVLRLGVSAVSIRGAAGSGGRTVVMDAAGYLSAADVHDRLVARLAGRAAEEICFGQPTSGAGGGSDSDLAGATLLAACAASAFGLDEPSGLIWQGLPDYSSLPEVLRTNPALAARVRQVMDEAYQEAVALLEENRSALEAVAAALEEHRALAGERIASIVAQQRVQRIKVLS